MTWPDSMGNHVLCSEGKMRCTEHCVRILPGDSKSPMLGRQQCDPAGAVFSETLEELNDIDRQLILFSSSSNVVAVRWLVELGANRFVSDSNGTTCLHAACRSGTVVVIETFIGFKDGDSSGRSNLLAVDVAGWTPLHVAVFMGRHDVVLLLLKAGAPLGFRTATGQTVIDLCSDARTRELIRFYLSPQSTPRSKSHVNVEKRIGMDHLDERVDLLVVDQVIPQDERVTTSGDVIFEPFFVLRNPVITQRHGQTHQNKKFMAIAHDIFNRQPGCGLSFLVASGCVRDYPMNLVNFLRRGGLDIAQIGIFLGEDFSLSKILRMEFINSVGVFDSGVVTSLRRTFSRCGVPPSLQKMDRLLGSLAEVWWRQNRPIVGTTEGFPMCKDSLPTMPQREFEGFELRQHLPSSGSLHQLLFSSIMIHWNLHAPLPQSQRISLASWVELNAGIGCGGADIPEQVLASIYKSISNSRIPELEFSAVASQIPHGESPVKSALADHAQVEGWARLTGTDLPSVLGCNANSGGSSANSLQMLSMLSEATASSRQQPFDIAKESAPLYEAALRVSKRQMPIPTSKKSRLNTALCQLSQGTGSHIMERTDSIEPGLVWLSLCDSLLFISARPADEAPIAFVQLCAIQLKDMEPTQSFFSIENDEEAPLQLVFLLPDGRWQRYSVSRLVIQVCDKTHMEEWVTQLTTLCSGVRSVDPLPT